MSNNYHDPFEEKGFFDKLKSRFSKKNKEYDSFGESHVSYSSNADYSKTINTNTSNNTNTSDEEKTKPYTPPAQSAADQTVSTAKPKKVNEIHVLLLIALAASVCYNIYLCSHYDFGSLSYYDENVVFAVDKDEKYHTRFCPLLEEIEEVNLFDPALAEEFGYSPCEICIEQQQ